MKNELEEWKGYTMRELQMHKAINLVRLEVEKERVMQHLEGMRSGAAGNISSYLFRNFGSISRTIGIIGSAFTIGRKVYGLFRRK